MSEFNLIAYDEFIEHRSRQESTGYVFPLNASSLGRAETVTIRARRLTTMDTAAIKQLPTDVQSDVWAGMKALEKAGQDARDDGEAQSLIEMAAQNEKILLAADEFCIAAFIAPRLVRTEQERNGRRDAWVVDRIAKEDRVTFFYACTNAASPAAKLLKLFRPAGTVDASGRVVDVVGATGPDAEDQPPVPMADAAIRTYEPQRAGV